MGTGTVGLCGGKGGEHLDTPVLGRGAWCREPRGAWGHLQLRWGGRGQLSAIFRGNVWLETPGPHGPACAGCWLPPLVSARQHAAPAVLALTYSPSLRAGAGTLKGCIPAAPRHAGSCPPPTLWRGDAGCHTLRRAPAPRRLPQR